MAWLQPTVVAPLQDVVLLQEVFVGSDAAMLAAAGAQGALKHSQYFPSGYLGGELLILSRWPIQYTRSAPPACACPCACACMLPLLLGLMKC